MGEKSAYESLNAQRRNFVDAYVKLQAQSAAAEEAGYKAPVKAGHRLMKHAKILAAIGEQMTARVERVKIDADYVLIKAAALSEANVLDFCEVQPDGSLKPTMTGVAREKAAAILEFKHTTSIGGDVSISLKLVDPIRALELVGKHTDVRAFLERHSVEDGDDLARSLKQAEARVAAGRKGNGDGRPEEERPDS